jgi:hypothetical protein
VRKTKATDKDYNKLLEDIKAKGPKAVGAWKDNFVDDILTPDEFYKKLDRPVESRAWRFFEDIKEGKADIDPSSQFMVFDLETGNWRWTKVKNREELVKLVEKSEKAPEILSRLREAKTREYLKKQRRAKEDVYGGAGFDDDAVMPPGQQQSGYEIKHEYTPLMGTPFFKQLYLYDMLLMHSKTFWYKNYSGPAKLILSLYRSFVIGKGFSVSTPDEKAEKAWKAYAERSNVYEKLAVWHDELMFAGELMLEKKFRGDGIIHESIDPSTIWDIITDPENITESRIKYYHQQYPTQYQLFGTKDTPITKYVIRQIPPEMIHHVKINVTSWEKRGRSDLLAALLYLKYFDDYIGFKLQRTKGETAYFWDVTIKGDANDVANYIATTQSIVDVNPGSENVHNEAVSRAPMAPSMSHTGSDEVAKWILSYIGMSALIPSSYFGTLEQQGASRASALVATEPITKVMEERRSRLETLLHKLWADVMIDAKLDPDTEVEFNFPELIMEDRTKKLQDLQLAYQEKVISHQRMSEIMAKELNISTYDYDEEQKVISQEQMTNPNLLDINSGLDLTSDIPGEQPIQGDGGDSKGSHAFDLDSARKDTKAPL